MFNNWKYNRTIEIIKNNVKEIQYAKINRNILRGMRLSLR